MKKKVTKDERLQLRVTPALKAQLTRKAEEKNLTISTLVLTYISKGLENDTQTEKAIEALTANLSKPENLAKLLEGLQTKLF